MEKPRRFLRTIRSRRDVLSLFEDREGNFWVGSESDGVTILRDQKITTYGEDLTRCVYQDRRGFFGSGPAMGSGSGQAATLRV